MLWETKTIESCRTRKAIFLIIQSLIQQLLMRFWWLIYSVKVDDQTQVMLTEFVPTKVKVSEDFLGGPGVFCGKQFCGN
jgi:hypothetical protein